MAKDPKSTTPARGPVQPARPVDTSIISKEERELLFKQAQTEIDKEARASAKAQLIEQFKNELRQTQGLDEGICTITLDMAPYVDRIMLDGVVYMHGQTYTVRLSVAEGMLEIMANTWRHQSEIDGKSENFYRRARSVQISPHSPNGGVGNILRA